MAILTTITARDYKDLKQNYSEKNIINQTHGNEYVISTASKTNLTDINGGSLTKNADVVSSEWQNWTPVYYNAMETTWSGVFGVFSQTVYIREEYYITRGSFSIETDEIITDPNNVSVKFQLRYDKYYKDGYFEAYNSYDSEYPQYTMIQYDTYKQNNSYLSCEGALPYEHAKAVSETIIIPIQGESSFYGFPQNDVSVMTHKLQNSHYKITVFYDIVTWWGYNYVKGNQYGIAERDGTLLAARKIDFTISANTVEAKEMEFTYSRDIPLRGGAKGKDYGIESNEFLQTQETTATISRKSSILSNEIFDKFDTDRTIVSFVLLNCEKYLVNGAYRYIAAEDLIYIEDENGQYLRDDPNATGDEVPAVFEVIKTRPIWNGSFEIEVTCRKVDSTT